MTNGERLQLLRELDQIQVDVPTVEVTFDRTVLALKVAQDRVKEIESMLASDVATRTAKADLGP